MWKRAFSEVSKPRSSISGRWGYFYRKKNVDDGRNRRQEVQKLRNLIFFFNIPGNQQCARIQKNKEGKQLKL